MSVTPSYKSKGDSVCVQVARQLASGGLHRLIDAEMEYNHRLSTLNTDDDSDPKPSETKESLPVARQSVTDKSSLVNLQRRPLSERVRTYPPVDLQNIRCDDLSAYEKVLAAPRPLQPPKTPAHSAHKAFLATFRGLGTKTLFATSPVEFRSDELVDMWGYYMPYTINYLLKTYDRRTVGNFSAWPHANWANHLAALLVLREKAGRPEVAGFERAMEIRTATLPHTITFEKHGSSMKLLVRASTAANPSLKEHMIFSSLKGFDRSIPIPPLKNDASRNILNKIIVGTESLEEVDQATREQLEFAFKAMEYASNKVGLRNKVLTAHEWKIAVQEELSPFRRDTLQTQRVPKHKNEGKVLFHNLNKSDREGIELLARLNYFGGPSEPPRSFKILKVKGISAAQMQKFTRYLNDFYEEVHNAVEALQAFAMHVDSTMGRDEVVSDLSGCYHRFFDSKHECFGCQIANVPCAQLIAGQSPLCAGCRESRMEKGMLPESYMDGYIDSLPSAPDITPLGMLIQQAIKKRYGFKKSVDKIFSEDTLSPLAVAKQADVERTIRTWAVEGTDVKDGVLGLGSLGRVAAVSDSRNPLLRPSITKLFRTHYADGQTYLFHHQAIAPTISGLSIAMNTGSVEGTVRWYKQLCLWQTRRADILASSPSPAQAAVQAEMTLHDDEKYQLSMITKEIPYSRNGISKESPYTLREMTSGLRERLLVFKIPFFEWKLAY